MANRMKQIQKENSELVQLIQLLQREARPVWRRTAELLGRSRRKRVQVNVGELDKYAGRKHVLLVPGKVLGSGLVREKFTVAAYAFSEGAKKLIQEAGGKTLSIPELKEVNAEGKGVLIIT